MKSGLEDRNNRRVTPPPPGRTPVSMKSGLEDRNNEVWGCGAEFGYGGGLNEVRPGRPEQSGGMTINAARVRTGLNEVRPGRPEQFLLQIVASKETPSQ